MNYGRAVCWFILMAWEKFTTEVAGQGTARFWLSWSQSTHKDIIEALNVLMG